MTAWLGQRATGSFNFCRIASRSNLGAALATLPRAQEIVGGIEVKLTTNTRLLESFAADYDSGTRHAAWRTPRR